MAKNTPLIHNSQNSDTYHNQKDRLSHTSNIHDDLGAIASWRLHTHARLLK
jgi:hypothetical protein